MPNPRARNLRKNLTDAERRLWAHLRLRQTGGHKFRRQRPIGPYIVDFVCLEQRLVVEVDGSQHMQRASHDSRRDAWLASLGFRVLRFWDNQVLKEMEAVTEVIAAALRVREGPPSWPSPASGGRSSHPHPGLPPRGGGREGGIPPLPLEGESQRGGESGQVLSRRSSHPHPGLPPRGGGREGGTPLLPLEGESQRGGERGQVLSKGSSHPHPSLPPRGGGREGGTPPLPLEGESQTGGERGQVLSRRSSHPHPGLPPLGRGREGGTPLLPLEGESQTGGERGQALVLAVILMAVGTLVLTPLLSQLATGLRKGGNEREQRMKVYAAEAALNRTIADLTRGADGVNTTYTTTEPHTGGSFQTYTITTAYTPPSVTVNNYTPTVTLTLPTASQAKPTTQQSYSDPGVTHPGLATVAPGDAYVMRLYNVTAGTLQVNWAYSPEGSAELKIWAGMPASSGVPIPTGGRTGTISVNPILTTASVATGSTFIRTGPLPLNPATDGSGGVYTILFFNKANTAKTTAAFAPSGGTSDTWIYVKSYKDYIVTSSVGGVSVSAYVRQVPGFNEPPVISLVSGNSYSYTFATNNVSFITSEVSVYTWNSP